MVNLNLFSILNKKYIGNETNLYFVRTVNFQAYVTCFRILHVCFSFKEFYILCRKLSWIWKRWQRYSYIMYDVFTIVTSIINYYRWMIRFIYFKFFCLGLRYLFIVISIWIVLYSLYCPRFTTINVSRDVLKPCKTLVLL